MKNFSLKLLAASAFVISGYTANAQSTFSQTSAYDTIANTPETLTWYIVQPDSAAFGTASLTVYYEGDFGANTEYIEIYDENGGLLGATQPYFDGNDCMQDSVTISFPANLLAGWSVDDTIWFTGVTTQNVDYFCSTNHARVKLDYNFCPNGGPLASMSIPQTEFCSLDAGVTVTTAPSGGTLSGPGISGNTFSAASLAPGSYTINYTYTNSGGCTSEAEIVVEVLPGIFISSVTPDTICPWNTAVLTATGTGHIVWYADAGLTMPLDSGNTFVTPQLMTTTSYYAATVLYDNYFTITSLTAADSMVVDHDVMTGDDRGGIAVTMSYVYIAGDDSTVRYDLDLLNPMVYTRVDGMVSDLANGQLYTIYNPAVGMPDANNIDSMYITELRTLNADLTLGSGVITLSDSIPFGWDNNYNNQSGIFAGNGFIVIFSAPRMSWYVIDLQDGIVTNLGGSADPMMNYSETWSAWGVAEFDGTGYSALYRDQNTSSIMRKSLPDGTPVAAYLFNDLSDMASFTYAPWNNRWYMHFEGGSQFNGNSETAVYATASDSTGAETGAGTLNCAAMGTVTVDICLGAEESSSAAINVYPNPTEGMFTINMGGMTDATIEVISVDGSLVYSEQTTGAQPVKEIDLSGAAAGVYLVRVTNAENVLTTRLIKQ